MAQTHQLLDFEKNFRAMAQTLIFGGFEPWLKPTFEMQILTSNKLFEFIKSMH